MAKRPESPDVPDIAPSELQEAILGLLEEAGIRTEFNDRIIKLVEEAEQCKAEADWERHYEHLMETGGGPSLQQQQIEAMKLK